MKSNRENSESANDLDQDSTRAPCLRATEPWCLRCVKKFSFNDENRKTVDGALKAMQFMGRYYLDVFQKLYEQSCWRDYGEIAELADIRKVLRGAAGLHEIGARKIRIIHGALLSALGAGINVGVSPESIVEAVNWISAFASHFARGSCRAAEDEAERTNAKELDQPLWIGAFDLVRAVRESPKLRGKTLAELEEWTQQQYDGLTGEVKTNIATSHGGRRSRLSVLTEALWDAVHVIEETSEEWTAHLNTPRGCADMIDVAGKVHDQVFLIDELLAMGCWRDDRFLSTAGSARLYSAIKKIHSLIDWNDCEALKDWMERAAPACEQHALKPGDRPAARDQLDRAPAYGGLWSGARRTR